MTRPQWKRVGIAPVVVLAGTLAFAGALAGVTRGVVRQQEHKLVVRSSAEAGSALSQVFLAAAEPLLDLNLSDGGPSAATTADFAQRPGPLGGKTLALSTVFAQSGHLVVGANSFGDKGAADFLTGPRADAAHRTLATGLPAFAVVTEHGSSRLIVAVSGPKGTDWATLQESQLNPRTPVVQAPGTPFAELRGAMYTAADANAASLVVTNERRLPIAGDPLRTVVQVGASRFVLISDAREPMVGAFAWRFPWILLAAGVIAALFAAVATYVLTSRRNYAERMVGLRTSELSTATDAARDAQQVAEAANTAKTTFLSHVSHELRTPLNAILGFGQLLESDSLNGDQAEAVGHILDGGRHLLHLVNEVLDVSTVETGHLRLELESVNIDGLVGECVELMRPVAQAKGVTLTPVVGIPLAPARLVCADSQRVRQVLLNLLSNAIRYNRANGSVTVATHAPLEGRLAITVTDTGRGIREMDLARLFVPFERLGVSDVDGIGLGLSLAQELAQAMNGEITVASVVGEGSTFTFDLPSIRTTSPAKRPAVRPHLDAERYILHIDSDVDKLDLVDHIVSKRKGFTVVTATTGTRGIEMARQRHPVLVVVDVELPDMSGEIVRAALRADVLTADIPVVVLSTDGPVDVAALLGVLDHLPVDVLAGASS